MAQNQNDVSSCTGTYTRQWGIPCSHVIRDLLQYQRELEVEDFDTHWHLERVAPLGLPQNPSCQALLAGASALHQQLAPYQQSVFEASLLEILEKDLPEAQEPSLAVTRGRPSTAEQRRRARDKTTRREPSAFEIVAGEGTSLPKRNYKCSQCRQMGHRKGSNLCPGWATQADPVTVSPPVETSS